MEELTDNAEEPDEAESKQSEVKLGKLQYKVRIFRIYNAQYNITKCAIKYNESKFSDVQMDRV